MSIFRKHRAYMVEGSVDVRTSDGFVSSFTAGPKERFPLAPEQAGDGTLAITTDTRVLVIDRQRIDTVLTWAELFSDALHPIQWLPLVIRWQRLAQLPADNVQQLLRNAVAREYEPGARIVTQG